MLTFINCTQVYIYSEEDCLVSRTQESKEEVNDVAAEDEQEEEKQQNDGESEQEEKEKQADDAVEDEEGGRIIYNVHNHRDVEILISWENAVPND